METCGGVSGSRNRGDTYTRGEKREDVAPEGEAGAQNTEGGGKLWVLGFLLGLAERVGAMGKAGGELGRALWNV